MRKYTVFVSFVKSIEDWDGLESKVLCEKNFDVYTEDVLDAYKLAIELAKKEADKSTEYTDYYISGYRELGNYNEEL